MKNRLVLLAAAVAGSVVAASAHAAPITFGPAQQLTQSGTDVSNAGTAAQAYTYGGGPLTINGVVFTNGSAAGFTGLHTGYGTNGTADAGYATLQQSANYVDDGGNPSRTVTYTGLTPNQNYQIQVFAADFRSDCCGGTRTEVISGDAGGTNATLNFSGPGVGAAPAAGSGSYAIGTFTTGPAETTQNLTFASPSMQVNAVVIRDLGPIPEPNSLGLLAIGSLGLLARRRRA